VLEEDVEAVEAKFNVEVKALEDVMAIDLPHLVEIESSKSVEMETMMGNSAKRRN
jgi:hypothetical protein